MERTPLKYFLEVCRTGSIAKAGRNFGVTPQAVAKAVRQLETELGYSLLYRTAEGSVPTVRGREVRQIGERMERFQQHAFEQMKGLNDCAEEKSTVNIGIWRNFLQVMPSTMLSDFLQLHPEVSITVRAYDDVGACERDICSGLLDVGFGVHEYDEQLLESVHTHYGKLYVIVSAGHRLAKKKSIRLEELHGENVICEELDAKRATYYDTVDKKRLAEQYYMLEAELTACDITPRIILPYMSDAAKRTMVREGNYVAFCMCPKDWLPYGIAAVDLEDVSICGHAGFLKARGRVLPSAVQKYLDFILPRFKKNET